MGQFTPLSSKLHRYLFFLFVFSIPFQARLVLVQWTVPFNEWTSAFLWITDILFLALLASSKFQVPNFKRSDFFLLLFLAIAAISITQALIPAISWYRFAKLVEYAFVFLYMRQQKLSPLVLKAVVASALLQSFIAIGQYALQSDLWFGFLGESVLDPHGQGVAVVVANSDLYLRAYGTTPHPNVLATWLMLGIWALIYWRPKWHMFALPILLVAFFLTFSRTAIAVWLVCSILLAFTNRQWPKKIIIITLITGVLFAIAFWPQVYARLHISSSDEAVAQRVFYNREARDRISFLGTGIGQFVPQLMKKLPLYPDRIYQPAHNMFLLMYSEIGIAGFVVFLLFLLFCVRRSPVVLAILLLALLDHYFWTLQQGGLMMWGLLGFFAHGKIDATYGKSSHPVPDRV